MKKMLIYGLCLNFFCGLLCAQVQNSSFKGGKYQSQQYNSQKNPADIYLDSARKCLSADPLKAIGYINKAIEESIKSGNTEKEASAFIILGDIQRNLGQADLAIENYKKCISAVADPRKKKVASYGTAKDAMCFQAAQKIAVSYLSLENTKDALKWISIAISTYGHAAEESELRDAKRLEAEIDIKKELYKEAREILSAILSEERKDKNTSGEIKTLLLLGKSYQREGNEMQATSNYTEARELSEKNKLPELTLQANGALATIYRSQKKLDKEVQVRNSNIQINNSLNNNSANSLENIEIGNAYLNADQTQQAETYINKGNQQIMMKDVQALSATTPVQKQLFSVSTGLEENANAYKTLAEKYRKEGDYQKAMICFQRYAQLQDSVKSVRERELADALAISTSIGKNQQRMDLLEKEQEINNKSIDILKQDKKLKEEQIGFKNAIIGSLSAVLLLMLVAVFIVVRSSKEKKRIHQLLALKSLRGQMNPHFIFNALNSVNHYVSQNDERKANRYLSDFSRLMRLVMDSSKNDFIPLNEELEMLGLYLQLEHTRFSDKFDYSIKVDENLEETEWMIPPMLIQPYLENAVWHGLRYIEGKGQLFLTIKKEATALHVVIEDNGIGRKKSAEVKTQNQKKQHSLGMQNIDNRIKIMNELFGTRISVSIMDNDTNAINCGTRVSLIIPQKLNPNA